MTAANGEAFRAGVGMLVRRSDGLVLALERSDLRDAWQLPQGGLNRDEPAEDAAWRELQEETGLTAAHVSLAAVHDAWIGYELPPDARSAKTGRGQVHLWFLFRLRDAIDLPSLPGGEQAEFRAAAWINLEDLVASVVEFRRAEYRTLALWLDRLDGPSAEPYKSPKRSQD